MSSLFGEEGKGRVVTHLLSVAGESLVVAEERPGLSDHRQQGRRLLESRKEEATDGNRTQRQTDRVRGMKRERCQYQAGKAGQSQVHVSSATSEKAAFSFQYQ